MNETRAPTQNPIVLRSEFAMRIISGTVLVLAVVASVWGGGLLFTAMVAVFAIAALREWHRLVNRNVPARETLIASLATVAVALLSYAGQPLYWPLAAIAAGAVFAGLSAYQRGGPALWHGFGAVYLGIPVLAIMELRMDPAWGGLTLGGIFAAVWATDTGALIVGRTLGGPRLAPALSPKKTWSGLIGGLLAAGLAEVLYVAVWSGSLGVALMWGLILGGAAHCGDLFESWVKRQFQAKNSGSLIPGHGGMLDRIDSLLVAAPVGVMFLYLSQLHPFPAQAVGAMP